MLEFEALHVPGVYAAHLGACQHLDFTISKMSRNGADTVSSHAP
jgi:hypothetical protein